MDIDTFIKIRNNLKSIKVKMSDGKYHSISIILKLDNDAWIDDYYNDIFYDDKNGIAYYFSYNTSRIGNNPMIGKSKINVPGELSVVDYGEIQEVKARLTEDAIKAVLDKDMFGAKYFRDGQEVELDDKLKKSISDAIIEASAIDTKNYMNSYRD